MTILIIEDNDTMREGMVQIARKMGHTVFEASSGEKGIEIAERQKVDFIITDLKMNDVTGMDVLDHVMKQNHDAIVMIITGYGSIETAVEAMKKGAYDFITKPISPEVLKLKIDSAKNFRLLKTQNVKLQSENEYFRNQEMEDYNFGEIIGKSPELLEALDIVKRVSVSDAAVLITGDSGTGKELIARAIHFNSVRKAEPFIKVNCGALAETLLESELFGHEKGSFTGAIRRKIGRFELASGGTIFLDEIGDFSPSIQLKLLRVLQEKEFERVGGTETIKVDVRVLSATNKDLKEKIKLGEFREDLFYRLHVVPIHVPPLRNRKDDIPLLTQYFLDRLNRKSVKQVKGFTKKASDALLCYNWPGNIRELENMIEHVHVLAASHIIDYDDLPMAIKTIGPDNLLSIPTREMSLADILDNLERQLIERAFKKANGRKAETARMLGVKTSALYYKLEKYGLITGGTPLNDDEITKV